jgi:hypothetical protein
MHELYLRPAEDVKFSTSWEVTRVFVCFACFVVFLSFACHCHIAFLFLSFEQVIFALELGNSWVLI